MFTQFAMTTSYEDTILLFENYLSQTGIIPKVIHVAEFSPPYENQLIDDNTIRGAVFLPPYKAMEILIDNNDYNGFCFEYDNYLNSDIPEETISIIMTYSMDAFKKYNGGGLVIFHFENSDVGYLNIILNYLYFKYGINLINGCHEFNFNTLSNIYNNLFSFNLISKEEFLNNVPKLENGNPNIYHCNIDKL